MLLEIQNIEKKYGEHVILNRVSLRLASNTTMSILGRSGCGKTTLLKIIAGIEQQDAGNIIADNINLNATQIHEREIVYLWQEPLLFPHLTVFENIAFGLRVRKLPKAEIIEKTQRMIQDLGLEGHERKFPNQISGGQKQRVAFGRAIVINPRIILLDEPFGNLDVETRGAMQQLFKQITGTYHLSALFVTHDLKEAVLMGDTYAYMESGNLTVYENRDKFIHDERTGFKNEINFWKEIEKSK